MSKSIRDRIEQVIVEEINVTNLIAQREPEVYLPRFIQMLSTRLDELFQDEMRYGKK